MRDRAWGDAALRPLALRLVALVFVVIGVLSLTLILRSPAVFAAAGADDQATWRDLKVDLFGERPIVEDDGTVAIEAPPRAHDAAIVPITIRALGPAEDNAGRPTPRIRALTLVIDENPAPVAAVFRLGPASGGATVATRVRINAYTYVRAIAETTEGALHMAKAFVKAAGGCSAPALKDQDEALANLGRMKLIDLSERADGGDDVDPHEAGRARLMIRHPNYSGLQRDPLTQYYIPAHFVRDIEVTLGGRPVIRVESAISLSENPVVEFRYARPARAQDMLVRAQDTDGNVFAKSWTVPPWDEENAAVEPVVPVAPAAHATATDATR